jgi:hypothetical protein
MASGGSSRAREWLARTHLEHCEHCGSRYEQHARAALSLARYRQDIIDRLGPLPSGRRNRFLQQLDLVLEAQAARPWWKQPLARWGIRPFGSYEPSFAGALVAAFAAMLVLTLWHAHLPAVSASEFMDRAVASDRMRAKITGPGVIRRRFRIETTQKTIERSVYLDILGRRQPRPVAIGLEDADLAARLALAGVSWSDPLSAASFQSWHDSQEHPADEVQSASNGRLTIRTRLQSSLVADESFTVRKDGFHPVERIIEYRDFGTVDISEIGLDQLSWNKTDELFFEPLPAKRATERPSPVRDVPLNAAQLNEAELRARLILNQQHADTGEQIEVRRDDKGVQVRGLVETEERKRELIDSLDGVPSLALAIQSFDDLKPDPQTAARTVPIEQRSSVAVVSPLEQYFLVQDRGRDDLSRISAGLFNLSLAIHRSSRLIDQINLRFGENPDLTPAAAQARDELVSQAAAQLRDALSEQQGLLREANITPEPAAVVSPGPEGGRSLADLAARNVALTQELVSGPSPSGRSGPAIAAELAQTILELQSRASQFNAVP